MTLTHEFETLFFILFASIICMLGVALLHNSSKFHFTPIIAPLPNFSADVTPTPDQTTTSSWTSSDGAETVTLKTMVSPNLSTTYVASVTDATGKDIAILSQTIPGVSSMSIPFNAFSSGDTYVFLKQTVGSDVHFLVFRSSGQPFISGLYSIDISPAFAHYTSMYMLSDVTGWASDSLLVINTKKQDGTLGPSYWYDVESHSFILLSTVFQ